MRSMRRKDREISREAAEAVIDRSVFAVLGTVNEDGSPYCVPLSIVREGEWIYFHCATEGQKTDNLRHHNRVCITCVGDTCIPEHTFTVEYESAMVFGTAEEVVETAEKVRCLRRICERHTPGNMAAFDAAVDRQLGKTAIWKVHIDGMSGKRNGPAR
ncbi:MAG: pyridoxamine 5'-phosphate oxidase family protein [Treponema sp.]|nr:pyridoxamine 5'-phosphate oxidase family protein [Treponema sp.]